MNAKIPNKENSIINGLDSQILPRCFAKDFRTAKRFWRRIMQLSNHYPHQQYLNHRHIPCTVIRLGETTASTAIVLFTTGRDMDCLLLQTACSTFILSTEKFDHTLLLMHHLDSSGAYWPEVRPLQQEQYTNQLLQAASKRLEPIQPKLDFTLSTTMSAHDVRTLTLDWLKNFDRLVTIDLRATLQPYGEYTLLQQYPTGMPHFWQDYLHDDTQHTAWDLGMGLQAPQHMLALHQQRDRPFLCLPEDTDTQQKLVNTLHQQIRQIATDIG